MDVRRDAGLAAAAFAVAANALVVRDFPGCVATVCNMHFEPGRFNVRTGGGPRLARVPLRGGGAARRARGCTAPRGARLTAIELPSGAGHDAQALAAVTPTGMIFVPSAEGASHQPGEHTSWEDCLNGANTLLHATLELCRL